MAFQLRYVDPIAGGWPNDTVTAANPCLQPRAQMPAEHPTSAPPQFTLFFQRPWIILRPRLYRLLEKRYVDMFFEDGSLRLSSFKMFANHQDEQRKDVSEGFGVRVGRGSDHTISIVGGRGSNAYVLCGTIAYMKSIEDDFNQYDACFVIDNTTEFAAAISLQAPSFVAGCEGLVIYQDDTVIIRNTDSQGILESLETNKNPDGTINMDVLSDLHEKVGGTEELFVKSSRYARQAEYRLIWETAGETADFIDVKAPDARQFCRRIK